ncbi:MAG: ISAs1 family transposase [Gemmataceae bacterium]
MAVAACIDGDALFCQRPLARVIIDAGRDYVLAVKDNQPDLHETVQTAFATATSSTRRMRLQGKRGAAETRRIWCDTETADYAREALNFPGLRAVIRVDRQTCEPDGTSTKQTRYFATSMDPSRVSVRGCSS